MPYDPRDQGAQCDTCPLLKLRVAGPVPPELHAGATMSVISDVATGHEVREGAPVRGPAGWEFTEAMLAAGVHRRDANYHLVVACQAPKVGRVAGFDAFRRIAKKQGLGDPVAACRPRLVAELEENWTGNIVTLGDVATKTTLHLTKGIMSARGGPRELPGVLGLEAPTRALATLHPAHALQNKGLRGIFWGDVARAVRHFEGRLDWAPFEIVYPSTPDELDAFLDDPRQPYWGWDIETNRRKLARNIRPLEVYLRCLSIAKGDGSAVAVLVFKSVDGVTEFFPMSTLHAWRRSILRAWSDGRVWVGHNSRWFDRMAMENLWGGSPAVHDDTIMLHRRAWPALPHRLAVVGTTLTDVTNWKTAEDESDNALVDESEFDLEDDADGDEMERVDAERQGKDEDLWERNAIDSIVTVRVVPKILEKCEERYPDIRLPERPDLTLDDLDAHTQDFACGMHRVGVFVNQDYRGRAETWLTAWADDLLKRIKAEAWRMDGLEDFNPGSSAQKQKLLYDKWGLVPREFSKKTGERSASDKAIRAHILEDKLPREREELLYLMRQWAKVRLKWLGTYVAPMAHERWKQTRKGLVALPTFLSPDGRVRASFNAHGTKTLRYSADKPPMQIIPKELRTIYTAEPGRLLFGADADQMHPRIVAAHWGIARLQEAFANGWDPYGVVAEVMFGRLYTGASGYSGKKKPKEGQAVKLRNIGKTIFLAMLYGALEPTVHKTVTKGENLDGSLAMADVTFNMTVAACAAVHRGMPEIRQAWERTADEAEANAITDPDGVPWLKDPVGGWRGDFPDGVRDPQGNIASDVINFKVLTAEAVLMHLREMELVKVIPWFAWGPGTGIMLQTHDSISGEAPASEAKRCAGIVADCLTYTSNVLGGMRFTAEPVFGETLVDA